MTLHLRQYVVGPEPLIVNPDWRSRELPSGLHLSHCPTLPVAETPYGLVLGDAIETEPGGDPGSWAGRWLLLTETQLSLDACGLLSCHLRVTDSGRWASSSPEILRALRPELPMHADRLQKGWQYMDWYPGPLSAIEGIERLLPSQALPLDGGPIAPVRVAGAAELAELADIVASWHERLTTCMANTAALASAGGGRVWISLTAGRDSRVMAAAARAAGIDAVVYTFVSSRTSEADRELPPRLAKDLGYEHVRIPIDDVDGARLAEFDRQTAASYVGAARAQHGAGGWEAMEPGAVIIEGGCLEAARCYYWQRLPGDMGATPQRTSEAILERFPSPRPAGVGAWAQWIHGAGRQDDVDWRDRFYIEQRCGSWLSAGRQGFDLSGRRMIYPGNCQALLSEGLSLPRRTRCAARHQEALVLRLAPAIAAYPYNPDSKKARKQARREARSARHLGAGGRLGGRIRRLVGRAG